MKPLYTEEEYNNSKSTNKLPCECYQCGNTFYKIKKEITSYLKGNPKHSIKYCSLRCVGDSNKVIKTVKCENCGNEFDKLPSELKRTKNSFCSHSCHITYVNKNKTQGIRRSKLEVWIEEQLTNTYKGLHIDYNKTEAIGSELDIFIPSLNLAIELNGIFHYEPIFGVNKLQQIQENDISKSKACFDNQIDLCIIDTSSQKYFKPKSSKKYLDIITNIINERLLTS